MSWCHRCGKGRLRLHASQRRMLLSQDRLFEIDRTIISEFLQILLHNRQPNGDRDCDGNHLILANHFASQPMDARRSAMPSPENAITRMSEFLDSATTESNHSKSSAAVTRTVSPQLASAVKNGIFTNTNSPGLSAFPRVTRLRPGASLQGLEPEENELS